MHAATTIGSVESDVHNHVKYTELLPDFGGPQTTTSPVRGMEALDEITTFGAEFMSSNGTR